MQFRIKRWRTWLWASPLWLATAGCLSAGSPPGQPMPTSARPQKPDPAVKQASTVNLPPVTLADGKVAVRAVAYVNNSPIFETEWRESVMQRARDIINLPEPGRSEKLQQIQKEELERLIEREAILEEANARLKKMRPKLLDDLQKEASREYERRLKEIRTQVGIQNDDQFQEFLAQQGMSVDSIKRQVERSFISMEYMRNLIFPKMQSIGLTEIREYYDSHPDEFKDEDRVKWLALFIDAGKFADREAARRFAEQTAAKVRGGADFGEVAKQLRETGVNPLLAHEGIGEKRGEIRPAEVEAELFRLKAGQVGAPVEMPGGFHVLKVTERSFAGRRPFSLETQTEIRKRLNAAFAEREYKRLVDDMKAKVVIQRIEP